MTPELSLIAPSAAVIPQFAITPEARQLKDSALTTAALIGKVQNAEQNVLAVNAQKELKRIQNLFEKERKRLKEPLLEAGRQLDRAVAGEILDIDKEFGRLSELTSEFQLAEQRRVREEEELQRRELARIEAEKQAELKRIADEQARVEREAREAREAAERSAAEATNKKQREAAAKAKAEAEEKERAAKAAADAAAAQAVRVEEKSAALTYAESRPIQATRVTGQVVREDWDVQVTNPYELARCHPDLVKIEPVLSAIKARLNQGLEVKGVSAKKKTVASVRAGMPVKAIDV